MADEMPNQNDDSTGDWLPYLIIVPLLILAVFLFYVAGVIPFR